MANWCEHDGVLYNLDNFNQIGRGDKDEILLSVEEHSGDWKDEKKYCSLIFKSSEEAKKYFKYLVDKLTIGGN